MNKIRLSICLVGLGFLAGCSEEIPPVSVAEFIDNERLLESTMVRCAQDRTKSRYDVECINARDAANRLEVAQEKTRRQELESQSERKRKALRRTQEAVAEARRRSLEEQRRREEEEYLGIFGQTIEGGPAAESTLNDAAPQPSSNAPEIQFEPVQENSFEPTSESTEETELEAVRKELKRRQESVE
jgi:hypothetical protein